MAYGDREEGSGGGRGFGASRPMYDAICSECGQPCQVPFKPTEGRPVYCRNCFAKHRQGRR